MWENCSGAKLIQCSVTQSYIYGGNATLPCERCSDEKLSDCSVRVPCTSCIDAGVGVECIPRMRLDELKDPKMAEGRAQMWARIQQYESGENTEE
jgi:hypothetical protein